MKILPVTQEDIPQLVSLIQTSYRGDKGLFRDSHLLEGERVTSEMIENDLLANPLGLLWKCVPEDNPSFLVGCAYTEKQPKTNMLFTGTLCVHPDFQTLGIGKMLMKAVEDRARTLCCCAITLQVVLARTALIQWYERQGFKLKEDKTMPFPVGKYGEFKVSPDMLALVTLEKDL